MPADGSQPPGPAQIKVTDPDPVAVALASIREREQAAKPGPWLNTVETGFDRDNEEWSWDTVTDLDGQGVMETMADLEFAAHARTDIPRLLAALDEVLKLAGKWDEDAKNQLVIVYNDAAMNEAAAAVYHKSASVRGTLAAEIRSAVLAGLTRKGKDGG